MISWRLAVLTILGVAVVAGCIAYLIAPALVAADQQLPPTLPKLAGHDHDLAISNNVQHPTAENHVTAFERAAQAILKRAPNVRAAADEPLFTGRIPLPKKRPIPRP